MAKKIRIELQLDPEKDAELLQFIDENGATRAGFIKHTLRHYMNTIKQPQAIKEQPQNKTKAKTKPKTETKTQPKKQKKKLPNLNGSSFSSKDL